jgi:hypothetical protein
MAEFERIVLTFFPLLAPSAEICPESALVVTAAL